MVKDFDFTASVEKMLPHHQSEQNSDPNTTHTHKHNADKLCTSPPNSAYTRETSRAESRARALRGTFFLLLALGLERAGKGQTKVTLSGGSVLIWTTGLLLIVLRRRPVSGAFSGIFMGMCSKIHFF